MNNQNQMIQRLQEALPRVEKWIENLLEESSGSAQSVCSLGFPRLKSYFPERLLESSKVVLVPQVPFPPLSSFGVSEFAAMEQMPMAGVTFKDTFFLLKAQASESTHFHELVHVVQWEKLGPSNFLLAYAIGLSQFGYRDSPFEKMAYSFQGKFDRGEPIKNLVEMIEKQTEDIWTHVSPHLQAR